MHHRLGVTYESAQTRRFKKGRTEVVRSVSNESAEWVKAMMDPPTQKASSTSMRIGCSIDSNNPRIRRIYVHSFKLPSNGT
jgi:hypothetical protein